MVYSTEQKLITGGIIVESGNNRKFKYVKKWLLFIAIFMPLIYFPFNGIFTPYLWRFIFLIIMFLIFLPFAVFNFTYLFNNMWKEKDVILLSLYYFLLILSTYFAENKLYAILGYSRLEGLIIVTIYCIIYILCKRLVRINSQFINVCLFIAALISIHAITQAYQFDPIPTIMYFGKNPDRFMNWYPGWMASTMGNPNFLGSFLVLVLPFSIYLYIIKNQKLSLILYAILFFALVCTQTRGAWIGACIAFSVLSIGILKYVNLVREDYIKITKLIFVSLLIILIIVLTQNSDLILRLTSVFLDVRRIINNDVKMYEVGTNRFLIWGRVLELIKQYPVLGIGIENLGPAMDNHFRDYMFQKTGYYHIYDSSHNEYLHIAVTTGIPSLIAYLGFIFIVLKKSFLRIKESDLYLPITASLVGFFTLSLFNNSLIMFEYLVWMLLGIAAATNTVYYSDSKIELDMNLDKNLA